MRTLTPAAPALNHSTEHSQLSPGARSTKELGGLLSLYCMECPTVYATGIIESLKCCSKGFIGKHGCSFTLVPGIVGRISVAFSYSPMSVSF